MIFGINDAYATSMIAGGASLLGGVIGSLVAPYIVRQQVKAERRKLSERVRAIVVPLFERILNFIEQCETVELDQFTADVAAIEPEVDSLQQLCRDPQLLLELEPAEISAVRNALSTTTRFVAAVRFINQSEIKSRVQHIEQYEGDVDVGAVEDAKGAKPDILRALLALRPTRL